MAEVALFVGHRGHKYASSILMAPGARSSAPTIQTRGVRPGFFTSTKKR